MGKILTASLLLCLALLSSCKKDDEEIPVDLGYDYFPNKVGSFVIFRVDSTHYGIEEENFIFQIKELNAFEFIDAEGEAAVAVERYKRIDSSYPWVLTDVWSQKRTPTTAQRVEENNRFIRLVFPIVEGKSWNGNAYNSMSEWTYTMEDVDQPADLGILELSKTLKVDQRYNVNLVDQEIAYELYARNIGLVFKRFTDIETQLGEQEGVDVIMTALVFGTEL